MKSEVSAETTFPSIQLSKTPKPTLSASGNNVPAIIAAIVGVLLFVLGTAIVAVVVALVVIRKKKTKRTSTSYTVDEKIEMDNLDNPIYTAGKNDFLYNIGSKFDCLLVYLQMLLPTTCTILPMQVSRIDIDESH